MAEQWADRRRGVDAMEFSFNGSLRQQTADGALFDDDALQRIERELRAAEAYARTGKGPADLALPPSDLRTQQEQKQHEAMQQEANRALWTQSNAPFKIAVSLHQRNRGRNFVHFAPGQHALPSVPREREETKYNPYATNQRHGFQPASIDPRQPPPWPWGMPTMSPTAPPASTSAEPPSSSVERRPDSSTDIIMVDGYINV